MKTTEKRIRCVPVIRLCFNRSNKRIGHYADILYNLSPHRQIQQLRKKQKINPRQQRAHDEKN